MPAKPAKRPTLAPASRYEVLAPTSLPGREMEDARLLPIDLIDHNPYQARQVFDAASLEELAESVREHGVLEPILVRRAEDGRYEIVAGERRYRAALIAEQDTIPARIMELDSKEAAVVTALENLQREDLDIEDEARQFAYLCEVLEVSQRELAKMLGKNAVYISRRVRLLKRPDLMEEYRAGRLTLHQAAAQAGPEIDDEAELISEGDSRGITISGNRGIERKPMFRWRPLQQFYNWVGRTQASDIPADERATVRAQLTGIKEALEKQLAELEQLENSHE